MNLSCNALDLKDGAWIIITLERVLSEYSGVIIMRRREVLMYCPLDII